METVASALRRLEFGPPARFRNLRAFPLVGRESGAAPAYLTLREAVAAGQARIREVTEGGSVPHLLLENFSEKPIFIMDGEELIGAKQNRCANVTILAPAGQTLVIPVSCVEAGRWSYRTADFQVSESPQFARGRARKTATVNASLRTRGLRDACQNTVWEEIAAKSERMRVASPTAAMADIYEQHRSGVEQFAAAIRPVRGQVGAVFAIGENVTGLDLFDASETLQAMLPKLVRSYAIDALETTSEEGGSATESAATAFIAAVSAARVESYPGVGLGTEIRLTGPALVAGGLAWEGRIIHLAAFAMPAASKTEPANDEQFMASAMRRRRMMGR